MMLVIGAIALVAALIFPPDIFWLMLFIGTVFTSSWGPVAIMSVWSRTITEAGAFWGMLSGFACNVIPKFLEEIDAGKTRMTLWAPWVLVANGLIMPFVLLANYVRPYQSATGTLRADGSIDWATGEAVLALSWCVFNLGLALIARRAIRTSYSPSQ